MNQPESRAMTTKNPVGRTTTKMREPKPEFLSMPVQPREAIGEVCRRAVRLAQQKHTVIRFNYQGMDLEAAEDSDEYDLMNYWFRNRDRKGAA